MTNTTATKVGDILSSSWGYDQTAVTMAEGHVLHRGVFAGAVDVLELERTIDWEHPTVRLFGIARRVPRMTAWFGEATYTYSGVVNQPQPMPGWLDAMRENLQEVTGARFNSVLLNRYRDGADSVAWHSDDEPELGPEPTIASVSFGGRRRFSVRRRTDRAERADVYLEDGDLLVMSGRSQADWEHCLPKTAIMCNQRVNATFRWVGPR